VKRFAAARRIAVACFVLLAACSGASPPSHTAPASARDPAAEVTRIADDIFESWMKTYPQDAAMAGLPGAPDDGLEDNALAAVAAWREREDAWARRLDAIDGEALWGRPEWITYGFVREFVDASRATRVCRSELWPVNHMNGWPVMVVRLADAQRVGSAELRDKALARWRLIPRYVDNEIANAREGLRLGYSSPRANVDLAAKQLDELLKLDVEKSPFWSPATRDTELAPAWAALLRDEIYPAIRRHRDFLRDEYRAGAREALGVGANPDGAGCYRAMFRAFTTIDRSPDETFQLGRQTVTGNLAEAQTLAADVLGVREPAGIVARLRADRSNRFGSREEKLELARSAVVRAKAVMGRAFVVLPKAEVVIEPYPAFLEPTASDSYQAAALDRSRPAKYRINLGSYADDTRSAAEVTAFHEAYPGHHLQITIGQETPERHPIVRLVGNSAFAEGWARYAEALAEELGLYGSEYGKIQRRLWPARGMVADPGLHLRGWTAEQTSTYLKEAGRFTDAEVDALIYRMAAWPAQLTAYDTGALEFIRLRHKAEEALGARFDLREFHRAILENGTVTLPMLRRIVDRWIATQQDDHRAQRLTAR
jgi:uncharacterized protein (DUF885 family)